MRYQNISASLDGMYGSIAVDKKNPSRGKGEAKSKKELDFFSTPQVLIVTNIMESLRRSYNTLNNNKLRLMLWHSLRLNAEVVARAWQILGGGQNIFTFCHSFFMCLVRNLQKKWKKYPKSIQLWLCIRYCTGGLTLRHVRL